MKSNTFLLLILLALAGCKAGEKTSSAKSSKGVKKVNQAQFDRHFFEAQSHKAVGNADKAEAAFIKSLGVDPSSAVVHYELARIAYGKNDNPRAIESAQKAYSLDKKNRWYALFLGDLYYDAGRFAEAEKIYNEILIQEPDFVDAYFKLAGVQLYQNKTAAAIKTLDKMEEHTGVIEELSSEKYRLYMGLDKADKAEAELLKLIKAYPGEPYFEGLLAGHYRDTGQDQKALELFDRMERDYPDNGFVNYYRGEFFLFRGQYAEGFVVLSKAMASPDLEIDMKINLMLNLFMMTEYDRKHVPKCLELCAILESTHPDEAKVFSIYGDFLGRDNRKEEALSKFRKAAALDPSRSPLWAEILTLEATLGKHDLLIIDSEKAIELFPLLPDFQYFRGFSLVVKKRYKEAIETLETGLSILLDNPGLEAEMQSLLGESYHKTGAYDKSDKAFKRSLKLFPDNPLVLNNYAYYLALRKTKLDEALEMSLKSNKLSPGQASFEDTLGYIYFIKGDYPNALAWFEKAIKSGGVSSGEVLEHYGDALYKSGDKESALEHWKMAQTAGGGSDDLPEKVKSGTLKP
jgi:tetratricopeptide (TPR) repeat protein